jgi:ribonuclease BN (tRNA processing enzyme)
MTSVTIRVLGCGDAFGSGGQFQTCFHVTCNTQRFLIDCGATALVAMQRFGVDPNEIDIIFLSHLHGDHFGGLPFLFLHAQFIAKRTRRLVIVGPEGTETRLRLALEVMFPGSSGLSWNFPLEIVELRPERAQAVDDIHALAYAVSHPSGSPSLGLRLGVDGKEIAYSGDTEWTESLIPLARQADLFITECYGFDQTVSFHLNYRTLCAHLREIRPKRVLLTHLSGAMLSRRDQIDLEMAEDGMQIEL